MRIAEVSKAIVGTGVVFCGALGAALPDVSAIEWTVIASATLVAAGAIFAVPNAAPEVKGGMDTDAALKAADE